MIQDIAPHKYNNQYKKEELKQGAKLIIIEKDSMLLKESDNQITIPGTEDFPEIFETQKETARFLYTIDEIPYFLIADSDVKEQGEWRYLEIRNLRGYEPMWTAFACTVGGQLYRWYEKNRFCGHCGAKTVHQETERAMFCPECRQIIYPAVPPSVIVGIKDGDRILLTKYAHGAYRKYSLVAGYAEIGESMEQTVEREVMEEVGLRVKNITYYKSQPWPISDTFLMGYFAELDGSDQITLQEEELAEATWFYRSELPELQSHLSLTNEMIEYFRNQE